MVERYFEDNGRRIIAEYVNLLREHISLDKVILFGSFARGQQHLDSDIDVAVISSDFSGDRLKDQLQLMRLRRKVDLRIEPIPFSPQDFTSADPLAKEIMDTGYIVYSK